ncbi:MAG TPA: DUF2231 domain-containing protein [Thermomicrobiaceae bacterium]|nr:DUF2231 domain-containing protein [Thermomicrobiaceae bacterium]
MESRVKLLGHPVHPMLVVYPLGLLGTSLGFDIVHLVTQRALWAVIAYWLIAAGVVGGALAVPFGLVDWLSIPGRTRARAIGAWHGVGNLTVLGLFAADWVLRRGEPAGPGVLPIALSCLGVGLLIVTGWLGGELIDHLGVGVDNGAHLNAPTSLGSQDAPPRPRDGRRRVKV